MVRLGYPQAVVECRLEVEAVEEVVVEAQVRIEQTRLEVGRPYLPVAAAEALETSKVEVESRPAKT
jgi:hypothetical protein